MQNKTFKKFIERLLKDGKVNSSSIGSTIKKSNDFSALANGGFIEYVQANSGGGSYRIKDRNLLENYYKRKFPSEFKDELSAVDNVHAFRNTKASKRKSQNVILIRGIEIIILNETQIDLRTYTKNYGTFSAVLQSLKVNKVCFVENLDSFLTAEQVIGDKFVFIHTYGGMSKSVVSKIQANEVLVFPDYDYVGLKNYLLVKMFMPHTKLFLPDNYEELFADKSRRIKTRQGRTQQPSKIVLESEEEIVVKIRTDIFKTGHFLEQQALFK